MKLLIRYFFITILSGMMLFAAPSQDEEVTLNFVNTPLSSLTKMISEITGLNFVSTGDIPGNFTFVSQKPIKRSNLLDIYEMILRSKGYMMVNYADKGFFMIVKNNDSQKQDIPFDKKGEDFQMVTELIDLKFFKPSEAAKIITPFLSPYGKLNANDELGYIMLTDYPDGISRIKEIVTKIDKQKDVELRWVKLESVNVKSVFPHIKEIVAKLSEKYRKPINVYMDATANSVIIAASGRDYIEVEEMVRKIDKDNALARKAQVIFLKNSVAEEIIKILQEIEKSRYESGEKEDAKKAALSFDKSLNAIIVLAEEGEVETYRQIIEDLDRPRKQVFVRADIVEINENKASSYGIEYDSILGGHANSQGGWAAGVNLNSQGAPTITRVSSLFDSGFLEGASGFIVGATLNLLKQEGIARTLSTPTILCLDNQESSIYVGQNMPVKTSTSEQESTTDIPVTNYKYKDIGLTLKVKPQIMNDNKVRLDVFTTLQEVVSGADKQLPISTKREVTSTSIVENGDNIIIAGLIKTLNTDNVQKVPLLGDIPFLGNLFKSTTTRDEKINLVIVLTPFVVSDPESLDDISKKLKRDYKNLQDYSHEMFELDEDEVEELRKRKQIEKSMRLVPLEGAEETQSVSSSSVANSPKQQSFEEKRGIITLESLQKEE